MRMAHKIVPRLSFENEAVEAAEFYVRLFKNDSLIYDSSPVIHTPTGDGSTVFFKLLGHDFLASNQGLSLRNNPAISSIVGCESHDEVDRLWNLLSGDGEILMPLGEYPWSEKYGWLRDKYGFSWQLILTKPEGDERPRIVPALLFTGDLYGKAEEAVTYYLSIFKDSVLGTMLHYGPGQEPNREDAVLFSDFKLEDIWLSAMDSADDHGYSFTEAVTFTIFCKNREEIDYYRHSLTADGTHKGEGGCMKDRFGLSWQVVLAD